MNATTPTPWEDFAGDGCAGRPTDPDDRTRDIQSVLRTLVAGGIAVFIPPVRPHRGSSFPSLMRDSNDELEWHVKEIERKVTRRVWAFTIVLSWSRMLYLESTSRVGLGPTAVGPNDQSDRVRIAYH